MEAFVVWVPLDPGNQASDVIKTIANHTGSAAGHQGFQIIDWAWGLAGAVHRHLQLAHPVSYTHLTLPTKA